MTMTALTIERLARLQSTLVRRAMQRDPENIVAVGFAPVDILDALPDDTAVPLTAQFDVLQKRARVAAGRRIESREVVRLLDRGSRQYDQLVLPTDVNQAGPVVPTGVSISHDTQRATTSLVVRWTTRRPIPPEPTHDDDRQATGWRWGVLTVSHLFSGVSGGVGGEDAATPRQLARLRRVARCDLGPENFGGQVAARGRVPGGPDLALVETGLDRLWLSGFLPRVAMEPITVASEADLLRWTSRGTNGSWIGEQGVIHGWQWRTFYPQLAIAGLGKLTGIVRYEYTAALETVGGVQRTSPVSAPFGPGSSGSVILAGGIPIGLQVAAMQPDYRIGYAQTLWTSLPWLQTRIRATALAIVHVVS